MTTNTQTQEIGKLETVLKEAKIKAEQRGISDLMYLYADKKIEDNVIDALDEAGWEIRDIEIDVNDYSSRTGKINIALKVMVSKKFVPFHERQAAERKRLNLIDEEV